MLTKYLDFQDWYCEACESHLNDQPGFTTKHRFWKCIHCGMENEVTEDTLDYSAEPSYECPHPNCDGHMRRLNNSFHYWICEECGLEATEENGLLWYED